MIIDPLSIFLAKLIGSSLIFIGLSMLVKPLNYQHTIRDIAKSNAIMTVISVIPLVAGLSIVLSHNIWKEQWIVLITIVGWIIFIAGIIRLFFHKECMKKCAEMASSKTMFVWIGIILLLLGIYLAGKGFFGNRFFG